MIKLPWHYSPYQFSIFRFFFAIVLIVTSLQSLFKDQSYLNIFFNIAFIFLAIPIAIGFKRKPSALILFALTLAQGFLILNHPWLLLVKCWLIITLLYLPRNEPLSIDSTHFKKWQMAAEVFWMSWLVFLVFKGYYFFSSWHQYGLEIKTSWWYLIDLPLYSFFILSRRGRFFLSLIFSIPFFIKPFPDQSMEVNIWFNCLFFLALDTSLFFDQSSDDQKVGDKIIFFDGVCGLCQKFVQFILSEDHLNKFKLSALQGHTAQKLLPQQYSKNLDSVVYLEGDKILIESAAIFRIFYHLGGFWRVLSYLKYLPQEVCDFFYKKVSKFRYQIFGKTQTCRLPTLEERDKFLD